MGVKIVSEDNKTCNMNEFCSAKIEINIGL